MGKSGKLKKSFASRDIDERPVKWRKYAHLFLIVCEDESTEPYYFEKFKEIFDEIYPNETVFLRPVGTGRNSKGVVEQAVNERKRLFEESNKNVDEVWAVFDKDDLDLSKGNQQRFVDAFEIAEDEKVHVAYSNEAFELWLLLHFVNISSDKSISRADIYTKLEESIRKNPAYDTFVYKHADTEIIDIVSKIGNEAKAIQRADKLNSEHESKNNLPIDANPNTRVNLLVKRLRDLIDWYSYEQ
jgi:hypothetical protein